jgi:hypothetical protein
VIEVTPHLAGLVIHQDYQTDALEHLTKEASMTKLFTSFAVLAVIMGFAGPAFAKERLPEKYVTGLRNNCVGDYMTKCMGISLSGPGAFQCLRKKVSSLSPGCQGAVRAVLSDPNYEE